MATYKVLQDIEAEDKIVGALTLRQFIYGAICCFFLYLSFFAVTKNVAFLLAVLIPPALFTGFLAIPWHSDQPTEVWAIAKLRFLLKPRKRIWDQSGAKDLVTITVPKKVERSLTNGLSQTEVRSRLHALADTIDSRGWAVKNVNVNLSAAGDTSYAASDRLVDASALPQEVSGLDIRADDDMLDTAANPIAQQFDSMITNAAASQRQQIMQQLQRPLTTSSQQAQVQSPNDYWFMHQPATVPGQATFSSAAVVAPGTNPDDTTPMGPAAATPTQEETALVAKLKAANQSQVTTDNHLKHIKTPAEIEAEQRVAQNAAAQRAALHAVDNQKAQVTSGKNTAILSLASNDDLDVATLARQARKETENADGEVVIPLR